MSLIFHWLAIETLFTILYISVPTCFSFNILFQWDIKKEIHENISIINKQDYQNWSLPYSKDKPHLHETLKLILFPRNIPDASQMCRIPSVWLSWCAFKKISLLPSNLVSSSSGSRSCCCLRSVSISSSSPL